MNGLPIITINLKFNLCKIILLFFFFILMDNIKLNAVDSFETFKYKRPYSINLMHRLFDREIGYDRNKGTSLCRIKTPDFSIFKCFTPNFTIQNVDKPLGFMRKFTPNGRLLLSFSHDQRALDIYEYCGVGAIADLLESHQNECITAADHSQQALHTRQDAFQRLLLLKRSIRLLRGSNGAHLNREFSIFIENGRYVILAAMGVTIDLPPIQHLIEYPDIFNELELFFYKFFLINLETFNISDAYVYKCDSIQLSHNHGVSAYGVTIAIYSRYRQCIDIFEIVNGLFQKLYTIGPNGANFVQELEIFNPDEMLGINSLLPLTHLKQRILTHIFRMYNSIEDNRIRNQKLKEFYREFPNYERMVISKMQLIDADHLLVRYQQYPMVFERSTEIQDESNAHPFKLYIFYCISEEKIIKLYFPNSPELLNLLRDHCDNFRNVRSMQTQRSPSSSSNNIYVLAYFNDNVSKYSEPCQRLNPTLPISTQSYTTSPYLDCDIFLYDERQISALERPRISTMEPIIFRDRITKRCLFRLNLELMPEYIYANYNQSIENRGELVAFIFHPYEPFMISVQKMSQRYVVNFHIFNKSTVVKQ